MLKRKTIVALVLIALALAACAQLPTPTPTAKPTPRPPTLRPPPTPSVTLPGDTTPTPTRLPSWTDDSANLAAYPSVVSVIVGKVVEDPGEETLPLSGSASVAARYGYWRVEVECYLVDPQPYEEVTLRSLLGSIQADGSQRPSRFPYSLTVGESAVLFLTSLSETSHPPLEENTFTVFLAPAGGGIREIRDGEVNTIFDGRGRWEPLEDFISRIIRVAEEAGRTTGEPESCRHGAEVALQ